MKTLSRFLIVLVLWAGFLAPAVLKATEQSDAWNVAVLDQILAGVKPGQRLAQVGDMQILVSRVQAWRDQLAGTASPSSVFDISEPSWTDGDVYYEFSTSGTNAVPPNFQKAFLDGAAEWATFANLHFIPHTTQPNFVTVQIDFSLEGGQSAVGMVGGQQFLSIGPNAWNRNTICHELGHTLGLVHEQERTDRDNFVTILTNNIAPGQLPNFIIVPQSTNRGPYDFLSVMHYSRNALSVDPSLDTIEPLPQFTRFLNIMGVPGPIVLSASDRAGMAQVYGSGPALSSIVTNTLDSGPGSLRAALYFAFDHPGTHITFNIATNDPGFTNGIATIQPTDQLPWLVNATILDGGSLTHFTPPLVQLNGSLAPRPSTFAYGVRFGGTNCIARGLIINGFAGSGILMQGSNVTGNSVQDCYLGTDPTGTFSVTNGLPGVVIAQGASGNIIGGLTSQARNVISGNTFQGLVIEDEGTVSNIVEGNYIGLNAAGNAPISNMWSGVGIFGGARSNIIGGTVTGARNVISGNGLQGVVISDSFSFNNDTNSDGNIIEGNYIGCDPAGTVAISNGLAGIEVFGGPRGTIIGGTATGAGNLLSGNGEQGIAIDTGSGGSFVYGNIIGLNASGNAALPNGGAGIGIFGPSDSNVVGGPSSSMRNYIAGNLLQGIVIGQLGAINNAIQGNYIGVNVSGAAAISNSASGVEIFSGANNLIGGTIPGAGNVISGNGGLGVLIDSPGANSNIVQGNFIGTNPSGTAPIGNTQAGIDLDNGPQNTLIGGTAHGAGNVISGNGNQGIFVSFAGTQNNTIQGNFIGVDVTGTEAISNGFAGIEIYSGAQSNLVGGTVAGAGNIISGNADQGIIMDFPGTTGNVIQGNHIGVDIMGTTAISNGFAGIEIYSGAASNTVGGNIPAARNIISGNALQGIIIDFQGSDGNFIEGNYIGLDATGIVPVPNGGNGIEIYNTPQNNFIGGIGGARNFISGNLGAGIAIDTGSSNNIVQGNSIGMTVSGTPAGNANQGIVFFNGAADNLIGGTTIGAANIIANNAFNGVELYDSITTNNAIRGNSMLDNNGGSGLVLFTGANNSIAAPVLNSATVTLTTAISGSFTGQSSAIFHLDFYASPPPASQREGKIYLGELDVSTSASGTVTFTNTLIAPVPIGQVITATATDAAGNTSSLSAGVALTGADSVGDGITDAWRAAHFGSGGATNASSCATCDPDHDGMDNLQEFLAGTDPNDPASALRVSSVTHSGVDSIVSFSSVQGISYRIEFRNDLSANGAWSLLADQIAGTGIIIHVTDPGAASLHDRFYRVIVLE